VAVVAERSDAEIIVGGKSQTEPCGGTAAATGGLVALQCLPSDPLGQPAFTQYFYRIIPYHLLKKIALTYQPLQISNFLISSDSYILFLISHFLSFRRPSVKLRYHTIKNVFALGLFPLTIRSGSAIQTCHCHHSPPKSPPPRTLAMEAKWERR
jgi:hypothetical protein